MAVYRHFYELPVYKTCRKFRKEITALIKEKFPRDEKYHLCGQALDAVRSVTANLAEGFGRYHYQENIQFCRQSRGSLAEVMEHMITAYDEGLIEKSTLQEVNRKYKACLKEINGYIKYLKTVKTQPNNQL